MKRFLLLLIVIPLVVSCGQNAATEFVEKICCYSDYSTVDWSELSEKYYRPNTADWGVEVDEKIVEGFPMEIATNFWHILQNARTDFHQKSLPLRAEATEKQVKALDKVEAAFDTVFVWCVSQEYYMRLLPEMYNEVMASTIDELVELLNEQNRDAYGAVRGKI